MFAVKTYENFHSERLPVLLNTWGKQTNHMRIFSNVANKSIPTISTGVTNTETGHCEKTIKILRLIEDELSSNQRLDKQINWLVLVDDDTILSVRQLALHLTCYSIDTDLYLGERYGYMLLNNGYNYITGGGGVILSRPTLSKMVNCMCPTVSSPDDMILATCLSQFGVSATHSPLFHQARPSDYSPATIDLNTISFHKYWQIDPYDVYERWFKAIDDNHIHQITNQSNQRHQRYQRDIAKTDGVASFNGYDGGGSGNNGGTSKRNRRCDNQIIKHSDYEMNHTDL